MCSKSRYDMLCINYIFFFQHIHNLNHLDKYDNPDDEFEYDDDDDFLGADELAADSHDAWDNKTWLQLTEEEKNAAQTLGWDKEEWDNGEKPDSCDLWWSELTTAEQYAATLLGWDKEEWDEGKQAVI